MSQPGDDSPRQEMPDETPEATPAAAFLNRVGRWVTAVASEPTARLQVGGLYSSYQSSIGGEAIRGAQVKYPIGGGVNRHVRFGSAANGIICLNWGKSELAPWDFGAFHDLMDNQLKLAAVISVTLLYLPDAVRVRHRIERFMAQLVDGPEPALESDPLGPPHDAPVPDAPGWYCRVEVGLLEVAEVSSWLAFGPAGAASPSVTSARAAVDRAQAGPVEASTPTHVARRLNEEAASGLLEELPGLLRELNAPPDVWSVAS